MRSICWLLLLSSSLFAQPLAPRPATPPQEPRRLPPTFQPSERSSASPLQQPRMPLGDDKSMPVDETVRLPHPEQLSPIDPSTVRLQRYQDTWQLWAGPKMLRAFGNDSRSAQDVLDVIRGLRPTEWGQIGSPRIMIEYGLARGKAPFFSIPGRHERPIDVDTVRAEQIRGVWCLRDDLNIHLNFGRDQAGAEQAAAVSKRYRFNRIGLVGQPEPIMAYFRAAMEVPGAKEAMANDKFAALRAVAQEQELKRTGIEIPDVGYVGERLVIDRSRLEVRRDQRDWVLAFGPNVIGRFGYSEPTARDALRLVRDNYYTEYCKVGEMSFFLVNGQAPKRIPFGVQARHFDPSRAQAREAQGQWGVYDGPGRMLFSAESEQQAKEMVQLIQTYKFDQTCQVGSSPAASMKFVCKSGR